MFVDGGKRKKEERGGPDGGGIEWCAAPPLNGGPPAYAQVPTGDYGGGGTCHRFELRWL